MCLKFTEFKDAASLKNNTFDGTKREKERKQRKGFSTFLDANCPVL